MGQRAATKEKGKGIFTVVKRIGLMSISYTRCRDMRVKTNEKKKTNTLSD